MFFTKIFVFRKTIHTIGDTAFPLTADDALSLAQPLEPEYIQRRPQQVGQNNHYHYAHGDSRYNHLPCLNSPGNVLAVLLVRNDR